MTTIRRNGEKFGKRAEKSRDIIIQLLQENPFLSTNALAEKIGISPRVVERHISKLTAEGILFREEADNGGSWGILFAEGKSTKN